MEMLIAIIVLFIGLLVMAHHERNKLNHKKRQAH